MPQWMVTLSPEATEELDRLSREQQRMILRALERMKADPFAGDVQALQEKHWKGRYRKRVGRWRLFFIPYYEEHRIEISSIRLRSEKTYR